MLFGVVKDMTIRFIFFLQALLLCFWWFEEHIDLPIWIRVMGRLHPAVLHLPIGILMFAVFVLLLRGELKKRAFRNIMMMVLLFASLTASITALLGFFLSHQSDYGAAWLQQQDLFDVAFNHIPTCVQPNDGSFHIQWHLDLFGPSHRRSCVLDRHQHAGYHRYFKRFART
jgi:hypothetical protein